MNLNKLYEMDKELYECEEGRALIDVRNDKLLLLFTELAMDVPLLRSRVKGIISKYCEAASSIKSTKEDTTSASSTKSSTSVNLQEPPKTLASLASKS